MTYSGRRPFDFRHGIESGGTGDTTLANDSWNIHQRRKAGAFHYLLVSVIQRNSSPPCPAVSNAAVGICLIAKIKGDCWDSREIPQPHECPQLHGFPCPSDLPWGGEQNNVMMGWQRTSEKLILLAKATPNGEKRRNNWRIIAKFNLIGLINRMEYKSNFVLLFII